MSQGKHEFKKRIRKLKIALGGLFSFYFVLPVSLSLLAVVSTYIESGYDAKTLMEITLAVALVIWLPLAIIWGWIKTVTNYGNMAKSINDKADKAKVDTIIRKLSEKYSVVQIANPKNIVQNSVYLSHRYSKDPHLSVNIDKFNSSTNEFAQESLRYGKFSDDVSVGDFYTFTYENQMYTLFELKNNISATAVLISPVDHHFDGVTIASQYHFAAERFLPKDFEKVRFENDAFMNKFRVYTTSQTDARVCFKTNVISAWKKYTAELDQGSFIEFGNQQVLIGIPIKPELFFADREGNISVQNLNHSLELIEHMIDLTQLLNINHEYLYKSKLSK